MTAITVMRKAKKNSSLRSPYLSSPRKVKVSATVMRTPAHRGMWRLDSKYRAIAVPITYIKMNSASARDKKSDLAVCTLVLLACPNR